jgi:adenylyltransferase/sulfurtransferase
VRAGIGPVKIVDRDFIELDNLQRQVLFDEATSKKACRRQLPPPRNCGR